MTLKSLVHDWIQFQAVAEGYASQRDIEKIEKEMKGYAPKYLVVDIQEDIRDFLKKDDLNLLQLELSKLS